MSQLLRTKLFIPQVRKDAVTRPHLLARLNHGLQRKMTLIAAPPGAGKTTLVADWLAHLHDEAQAGPAGSTTQACWLSLDAQDNDFTRFVTYLVAALQTLEPAWGEEITTLLTDLPGAEQDALATLLINELTTIQQQTILVLDDYQLIDAPAIHTFMTRLLDYMPPALHLVLTTRADPPWPLSPLRVRNELTEVRARELVFDASETAAFLDQTMHLHLATEDVALLATKTEGWIAGLQLAGLALQSGGVNSQEQHAFVTTFAGTDRYVVDYLVGEVLERQPPYLKDFLLWTAPLDRFDADLCDHIRRGIADETNAIEPGSQEILSQLEAANLFIIPLDNERRAYRYHHLFADLLRFRLRAQYPELAPHIHTSASEWYAQNGLIEEAVQHALLAKSYLQAATLIEGAAHDQFSGGGMMVVQRWLAELPDELIYARPQLYLIEGLLLFRTGQFRRLETHLQHPLPTEADALSGSMYGQWQILQAYVAYLSGEFAASITLLTRASARIPATNLIERMPGKSLLAWCYEAIDDINAAIECHLEVATMAEQAQALTGTIVSTGKLVQLYEVLGNTQYASHLYDQLMVLVEGRGGIHIPLIGVAYIGKGQLLARERQISAAIRYLEDGIAHCRQWGGLFVEAVCGYGILIQLLQSTGQQAKAEVKLFEARRFAHESDLPEWAVQRLESQVAPAEGLPEPLTPRELDVLRWMAADLSSPQIAEKMIVSVSTVRTHIKHIYGKLGVHSRYEAVAKARELQIL